MADVAARLEINVRTPHGAPVAGAEIRIEGGAPVTFEEAPEGVYRAALASPGDASLVVARRGKAGEIALRTLRAELRCTREPDGTVTIATADREAAGRSEDPLEEPPPAGGKGTGSRVAAIRAEQGVHRISIVLDYLWFTPVGYPPTEGNRVEILVDGEEAWASVAKAIGEASRSIHLTSWIYQPTTELLRPDPLSDPDSREHHTAQRILEERARAGATVRFLLWDAPVLSLPHDLHRADHDGGVRFQVLEEPNPTTRPLFDPVFRITNGILGTFPIGSYHQKTVVADGRVGFCGGMNLKENDWDTRAHGVFDPRRCAFSASAAARAEVARRAARPDHLPRHDFMARVEGPAVAYLEESFRERWNRLVDAARARGEDTTATPVGAPEATPPAGTSPAQIARTMPVCSPRTAPERGILDVYRRAIRAARRLIYIEDQYFRSTHVSAAIAEALRAFPDLAVVVITSERQSNDLFAGGWSRTCYERIALERPGFELHALRVGEADHAGRLRLEEVDTHAKLLIVDDAFVLVGSANVNDRGFEVDGEIDVAVADPELARRVRVDLWREHLANDPRLGQGITSDLAVWREHVEQCRGYDPASGAPPRCRVYPFVPRRRRWTLLSSRLV